MAGVGSVNMIQQLTKESFAHSVREWQVIETHISWVLLTGEYAYKIKKPVKFEFVDYSSLSARHEFCLAELVCNRRFSDDLYLSVVPIINRDGRWVVDPARHGLTFDESMVAEYAVQMVQFRQQDIVGEVLATTPSDLRALADAARNFGDQLARRHRSLPKLEARQAEAYRTGVEHDTLENFIYFREVWSAASAGFSEVVNRPLSTSGRQTQGETDALAGMGDGSPGSWGEMLETLANWSESAYRNVSNRLAERVIEGEVRQCHGDLHLQNMVVWQGHWMAFDGIEFNERFQWIDLWSELAFPAMDLIVHGHADLAFSMLSHYLESSGEYKDPDVLRFFMVYRAMVRAKVLHLKFSASDSQGPTDSRVGSGWDQLLSDMEHSSVFQRWPLWQRYLAVAWRLAFPRRPTLWLMHGLSGSGKSTVATDMIGSCAAVRLRTDRLRQLEASVADEQRYEPQERNAVYQRMAALAERWLAAGFSVIADATFFKRGQRDMFTELAQRLEVPYWIVACEASVDELERRIRGRTHDISEANLDVLHQQIQDQEPLTETERERTCTPAQVATRSLEIGNADREPPNTNTDRS